MWKKITAAVVGGREEIWEVNAEEEVISVMVDIFGVCSWGRGLLFTVIDGF